MSNPTIPTRHVCTFIPAYILDHIAQHSNADEATTTSASKTIEQSQTLRGNRAGITHSTNRPAGSGFIPGFVLQNLADSQEADDDTRAAASGTLDQQTLIGQKDAAGPLKVQREVHDANHSKDYNKLPGALVTSDAKLATTAVQKTVTDCFENLGVVFKFFAEVFQRNSIDDKGMVLIGTVHFSTNFENAFWDGKQMVFGDGGSFLNNFTGSLDVVGHELTHGVTEYTAKLDYENQSGALNESISDCFGSMIRQYRYKETAAEADWLIGEDCILPDIKGLALRSMKAPGTAYDDPRIGKDPQPAHMKDYNNSPSDNGGVHINSGIPNRAFFLAATAFGGHSWEKAGPVWYGAINSKEITNKCTFEQFANITVSVAQQLFKDEGAKVVKNAWTTVGVLK